MKNNFTKDDLKVGYVVKYRNGTLAMVMPVDVDDCEFVTIAENDRYTPDYLYNRDLTVTWGGRSFDIVEVYGFSKWHNRTYKISTDGRELLWKREEKTCDNCAHKVVCTHVGMCEHYMEKAK